MKIEYIIIFFTVIWMAVVSIDIDISNKRVTSQIGKEQLDITESRKREDLLLQQVKLLEYQMDILSTKDLK